MLITYRAVIFDGFGVGFGLGEKVCFRFLCSNY